VKALAKTVGVLSTIIFVTVLIKKKFKPRRAPAIQPVSDTFLISCHFFEPSALAENNQGDITKNCGSCTTWTGENCGNKTRLKSHYNI
jgi:hypothetical protein